MKSFNSCISEKKISRANIYYSKITIILICLLLSTPLISQTIIHRDEGNFALYFDGANSYLEIPNNVTLQIENQMTLECWIHFEAGGTMQPRIISKGPDGQGYELLLTNESSECELEVRIGPGQLISNTILSAGNWYHVATTYDGSNIKIYIDGILDASQAASGDLNLSDLSLHIGQKSTSAWDKYKGLMDEIRIWDKALSQSEIQVNMFSHLTEPKDGLAGYWPLNEGTGVSVNDLSGNNNHGTIIEANWVVSRAPIGNVIIFCNPNYGYQNHNLFTSLQGANTHFLNGPKSIWLAKDNKMIIANRYTVKSNTLLEAKFYVPPDASIGLWDINIEMDQDSIITMPIGIEILPPPSVTIQTSSTSSWLRSLYAIDNENGWSVGNNGSILRTKDGGTTWESQNSGTSNVLYSVYFADEHSGWTVGQYGIILSTANGGEEWNEQNSGTAKNLQSVCFVDANLGWSVGSSGTILKTTDGGSNWKAKNSGTTTWLYSVCFKDGNNGWAVGSNGTILNSINGGETWESQISGTTNYLSFVYFYDSNTGWAVGSEGTILKTTDGGKNWTAMTSNTDVWLKSIFFRDTQTGWAIGTKGELLMTLNGGESWSSRRSFTNKTLSSVYFADDNTGWVVGETGLILNLMMNNLATIIKNEIDVSSIPKTYKLFQNYPNPFNPRTMINYELPITNYVELSIYNLLGQKIVTLVSERQKAGIHQVEWNGTDQFGQKISSGIYLYKLQTDTEVQVRKMIFIK